MHATIAYNQSITRVLQYHDLKLRRGQAECIHAGNFIKEVNELSYIDKWYHYHRLTTLNEAVRKNILHVFLSFGKSETIDNEKMGHVAQEYLEEMGFGRQPYLVYRHYDSYVQHAHLVSTNIDPEGKKIRISLADLYESRRLTHRLEEKYSLQQTMAPTLAEKNGDHPIGRIQYGEMPLLPAMNKVLEMVVPEYAYTSLEELNAVLSLYNIRASRGPEDSRCYEGKGLVYKPLRADGRDAGAFIQASTFPSRPTLNRLEERFEASQSLRERGREQLKTAIDWSLAGAQLSLEAFKEAMEYERVSVVRRQDKHGALQNVWFVDHEARTVFEGATLGENYSAAGLSRRCIPEEQYRQQQQLSERETESQHLRLHL